MSGEETLRTITLTPLMKLIIGFDIFVTAWMATPVLSNYFIDFLGLLGSQMSWTGDLDVFTPFHMFMVNLAGLLGVTWNITRWKTASWELARIDAWARLAVTALILFYLICYQVTPVLLLFVLTEVLGSIVEFTVTARDKNHDRSVV